MSYGNNNGLPGQYFGSDSRRHIQHIIDEADDSQEENGEEETQVYYDPDMYEGLIDGSASTDDNQDSTYSVAETLALLESAIEEAEDEIDFEILYNTGGGGGGSPSPSSGDPRGRGADPETIRGQEQNRVRRSSSQVTSVYCDDEDPSSTQIPRERSTALPLPNITDYASAQEFIFSDEMGLAEDSDPLMLYLGLINWFQPAQKFFKHNKMIPSQFYYNSLNTRAYDIRSHSEQSVSRHNLGSLASSNLDLNDNLRYVLGCVWEHSTIPGGTPLTVLEMATQYFTYDTVATDISRAMIRRGIYFCLLGGSLGYGYNLINALTDEQLQPSDPNPFSFKSKPTAYSKYYDTNITLVSSVNFLRMMAEANPSEFSSLPTQTGQSNVYNYLKYLASAKEGGPGLLSSALNMPGVESSNVKYHYDHTFRGPAAYKKNVDSNVPSEMREPNEVSIKSFYRRRENFNLDQERSILEVSRPSIYRKITKDFGYTDYEPIFGADGTFFGTRIVEMRSTQNLQSNNLNPLQDGSMSTTRADIIQKFPARQVKEMQRFNDALIGSNNGDMDDVIEVYSNDGGQRSAEVPFEFWKQKHLNNYNLIEFKMSHKSQLAALFQASGLDTLLFELIDLLYPYTPSHFVQILDLAENRENRSDMSAINLTPNEIRSPINVMEKMLKGEEVSPFGSWSASEIESFSYPLLYDGVLSSPRDSESENMHEKLLSHYFFSRVNEGNYVHPEGEDNRPAWLDMTKSFKELFQENYLSLEQQRSGSEILSGMRAYSEVLAYRVVKVDAETEEVVQEFLFANNSEVENFKFIDSQVVPGKRYVYRIFTINFVVGSKYCYKMQNSRIKFSDEVSRAFDSEMGMRLTRATILEDGRISPESTYPIGPEAQLLDQVPAEDLFQIDIPMQVVPSFKIIEAPYHQQEVVTISYDLPPLYPDVQILRSYRENKDNLYPVMIYPFPRFGYEELRPVVMESGDSNKLRDMLIAQQKLDDSNLQVEKISYRSDTPPQYYEMFYAFEPPTGYEFFESNGYKTTTTAETKFFDLDVPFNVNIYMTFRAIDQAGFSNPSPIYVMVKHNYGDGVYTSFEEYVPEKPTLQISCERLISIQPSLDQEFFNISRTQEGGYNPPSWARRPNILEGIQSVLDREAKESGLYPMVPKLEDVELGKSNTDKDLLWNRKFKFRFTSFDTLNSFDVNCGFNYKKVEEAPLNNNSDALEDYQMTEEDEERAQRRASNRERSIRDKNSMYDRYANRPAFADNTYIEDVSTPEGEDVYYDGTGNEFSEAGQGWRPTSETYFPEEQLVEDSDVNQNQGAGSGGPMQQPRRFFREGEIPDYDDLIRDMSSELDPPPPEPVVVKGRSTGGGVSEVDMNDLRQVHGAHLFMN